MKRTICLLTFALAVFCAIPIWAKTELEHVDGELRKQYIKQAHVWKEVDVSKMDILAGPQNEIAAPPGAEVTCRYVPWPKDYHPSGAVPKFLCKLVNNGAVVRVKYGRESREVYSEVAATRLFWALGFYADEVYPVKLRCLDCPQKNPFKPEKKERRMERIFDVAIIERDFPGESIEESKDQGWAWDELDNIDPEEGATKSQTEALKLLAVFVQHSDNKPKQQRLACYHQDIKDPDRDGIGSCSMPVMMVQDLGATFGSSNQTSSNGAKMNFEGWSKRDIWNHDKENHFIATYRKRICYGNLTNSLAAGPTGLNDPEILEAGRVFLASLLNQLSVDQIGDLFRVAGVDQLQQSIEEDGHTRPVTVEDWVQAFIHKREEINRHECAKTLGGEIMNQ